MQSMSIMFLVLLSIIFLYFPLSSRCNPVDLIPYPGKDWLDRCDINRFKQKLPTSTPSPVETTTKKKHNIFIIIGIVYNSKLKTFPFRPLAEKKEILEILKQKIAADSKIRGEPAELDPNDAKAFIVDNNDYAYYEETPL